ncbi:hydantoinase/oxoprolinase family protein [Candidatus Korarchaeum cryptofilum]|jgi:N-methylhydantoinase A|uniref:hydantoinase/oxoprolinase family protein n=1 Tax=Candidatus Korarchaeum cryptofilum TaxID=498846 RepID=UPI00163C6375|nr:hydantoinase/oxoprolinase family protein [Candidatus Korarchaeum cryptofilum]
MRWKVGIDIGGAFTDLYAVTIEGSHEEQWIKVESTPPDFENGVIEGIEELEGKGVLVRDTAQVIHGQTVVINTITTRKGANVGFLTTEGFDTLEIQRANRRDIFNFRYKKPTPFVPRYMVEWIPERIDSDGSVHKKLDEDAVRNATESLIRKGAQSFAIGFINSYINPKHELRAKEIVEEVLRENGLQPYVTASSELNREWREYERFNTAVLNAYVQPIFVKYIEKLENTLKSKGFNGVFYITLSSGGVVTSEYAKKYPIFTIEGGPISGIMGGIRLSSALGSRNIIVIDGGSTTTKAGIAKELTPKVYTEYWIEQDDWNAGYPLRVPTLDITEIGLGGTSLVWVDDAGNLRVGPQAAGARPGPACYGQGGDKPTLTDAYVLSGFLNPQYLLGGKLRISKDLAEKAMMSVAKSLNLDLMEASYGAVRLANDNAANLIRQISVKRGYDPREFTLIAHGGAGPMFAPFIAEELNIPEVVVPAIPSGVFNSWGMIGLDIRHEVSLTDITSMRMSEEYADYVNSKFDELEQRVREMFKIERIDVSKIVTERYLDIRYEGQAHTLKIPCSNGTIRLENLKEVAERFHKAHYDEYGFSLPQSGLEIVGFHVAGMYRVRPPELSRIEVSGSLSKAHLGDRILFIDGREITVPVYKKESLPPEVIVEGPCIIEGDTATTIVTKGFRARHDVFGNLILTPSRR